MFRVYAELFCSQLLGRLFVENDKVRGLRTEDMWGFSRGRWWGMVGEIQELREEVKGGQRVAGLGAQSCGGASGTCVQGYRVLREDKGTGTSCGARMVTRKGDLGKKR